MKVSSLINYLETIAPSFYQESYDNTGLITGNPVEEVQGVIISLDATEAVVEEAIQKKCNLIVAHHPIIFKGLKKITGRNYVERTIIKAIKNDIAIYAIHTNLDNVYHQGVNAKIAEMIGLINTRILSPKKTFKKLYTFVSTTDSDSIRNSLFNAGAGKINSQEHLSYATVGAGTSNGTGEAMVKLEVLFPAVAQTKVLQALQKSDTNKTINYDIITVENSNQEIGSGLIGELKKPLKEMDFLVHLKEKMEINCIKYTQLLNKNIKKIAVCGGSGGFLLRQAIQQKADIFITADYKYHEYFDADSKIVIADIGHYESEQFTIQLLYDIISKKFSTFAVHCTDVNTNPVNYLF